MAQAAADYTSLAIEHTDIWNSDYMPFEAKGYVCIGVYEGGENPHYHKTTDTAETVNLNHLAEVSKMVLATVYSITDKPGSVKPNWRHVLEVATGRVPMLVGLAVLIWVESWTKRPAGCARNLGVAHKWRSSIGVLTLFAVSPSLWCPRQPLAGALVFVEVSTTPESEAVVTAENEATGWCV